MLVYFFFGYSSQVPHLYVLVQRRHTHETDNTIAQPVKFAHIDQTAWAALARARQNVSADELDVLLKGRFQIINLWRPITHAAVGRPLAVCDYRSMDLEQDVVPFQLMYSDRMGELYLMKHHPRHQWKYLRGMDIGEVLVFKWLAALPIPKCIVIIIVAHVHMTAMTLLILLAWPDVLVTPPSRIRPHLIQRHCESP